MKVELAREFRPTEAGPELPPVEEGAEVEEAPSVTQVIAPMSIADGHSEG